MSHIGDVIELNSSAFPVCEEDNELGNNDSMHGYALARYIADGLVARGFEIERFVPEDFGWWVEIRNEGFTLSFSCCSYNRSNEFVVFVSPDKPIIRRWFRKIDVSEMVEALNAAIFSVLQNSEKIANGPKWQGGRS